MEQSRKLLVELNIVLAQPDIYESVRRQDRIDASTEHGSLTATLEETENDWLALQQELETLV